MQIHNFPNNGKQPLEPPAASLQPEADLHGASGSILQGGSRRGPAKKGNKARRELKKIASDFEVVPSTVAVNENIEGPATAENLLEIPFNEHSTERLGTKENLYMEKAAKVPNDLSAAWDERVKPMLDSEVRALVQSMNRGKDNVYSLTQLKMVGTKCDDCKPNWACHWVTKWSDG